MPELELYQHLVQEATARAAMEATARAAMEQRQAEAGRPELQHRGQFLVFLVHRRRI